MIYTENGVKAENPRKSRENVTRKREEKPKIRVSPPKILRGNERKAENPRNREKAPVLRTLEERKGTREAEMSPLPYL
ncbi:MAG: hypothetical protein UGE21_03140 [Lachnospiraceae bacterium]|nr:hypothetical protein [Lachnospiraceae bacterium]